jgi:hypothetical protein
MISVLLLSCKKPATEPSFYFWRTTASLSAGEKKALEELRVHTLYLRFFDVDVPNENGQAQPLGVIDSLELLPKNLSLVPVIYITNRTFTRLKTEGAVTELADKILKKINALHSTYNELQIDCDWSEKTREHYFLFLKELKKQLPASTKITATIRLHQVKYPERTGVPPVDGGMLMFYNMGNLHNSEGSNSIFDVATASAYTAHIKRYKLHLDAALPIFRWVVHYRNGTLKGLISKKQLPELKDTSYFYSTKGSTLFSVRRSGIMHGVSYEEGDVLKYEALNETELLEAAELLQKNLYEENRKLILYDLDDININYYDINTLQKIYSTFD